MITARRTLACVFWSTSFLILPTALVGASGPLDEPTRQLLNYADRLVTEIEAVELSSKLSLTYPSQGFTSHRTARLRIKGEKLRADIAAEILSRGDGAEPGEVLTQSWTATYDGQVSRHLPSYTKEFTIWPGRSVAEFGSYFPGAYMNGIRLDKWLASMELVYESRTGDPSAGLHLFTGLRALEPGMDGKPQSRTYKITASEAYGFAIVAYDIRDAADRLLSRYKASQFQQVLRGLWLPALVEIEQSHGPEGQVSREDAVEVSFGLINQPIDDAIFEIVPPPDYMIVDNARGIRISPGEFEQARAEIARSATEDATAGIMPDRRVDALENDLQPPKTPAAADMGATPVAAPRHRPGIRWGFAALAVLLGSLAALTIYRLRRR